VEYDGAAGVTYAYRYVSNEYPRGLCVFYEVIITGIIFTDFSYFPLERIPKVTVHGQNRSKIDLLSKQNLIVTGHG
jgi:hypothetical protein